LERNCRWIRIAFYLHISEFYIKESLSKISLGIWTKILLRQGWYIWSTWASCRSPAQTNNQRIRLRRSFKFSIPDTILKRSDALILGCWVKKVLWENWPIARSNLHKTYKIISSHALSKAFDHGIPVQS
jgi:hypothetical protein